MKTHKLNNWNGLLKIIFDSFVFFFHFNRRSLKKFSSFEARSVYQKFEKTISRYSTDNFHFHSISLFKHIELPTLSTFFSAQVTSLDCLEFLDKSYSQVKCHKWVMVSIHNHFAFIQTTHRGLFHFFLALAAFAVGWAVRFFNYLSKRDP